MKNSNDKATIVMFFLVIYLFIYFLKERVPYFRIVKMRETSKTVDELEFQGPHRVDCVTAAHIAEDTDRFTYYLSLTEN